MIPKLFFAIVITLFFPVIIAGFVAFFIQASLAVGWELGSGLWQVMVRDL